VQVLLKFLDLSAQDLQQHRESRENNSSEQQLGMLALGVYPTPPITPRPPAFVTAAEESVVRDS
jgi:hypothetical protein